MITKATETIIGVNSDKNFGRVMVFGTGGIYTEIMKDTTLRILPANDFDDMIKETKVGRIRLHHLPQASPLIALTAGHITLALWLCSASSDFYSPF